MTRIPGKHVVYFGSTPVVMSDSDYKRFVGGKVKGKRKSAADRAWEKLGKEKGK